MDPRIAGLARLVTDAPLWVWALLAVLIVAGLFRRKARVMPLARFTITPAIFFGWGLLALGMAAVGRPELIVPWGSAAAVGGALGWVTAPTSVRGDRVRRRIYVPGSSVPLWASIIVFALKYACGTAMAIRPDLRPAISLLDMGVSGASAGFFVAGWFRTFRHYRLAPSEDLTTSVATA